MNPNDYTRWPSALRLAFLDGWHAASDIAGSSAQVAKSRPAQEQRAFSLGSISRRAMP